jgi:predicted small lipoprotein YifL
MKMRALIAILIGLLLMAGCAQKGPAQTEPQLETPGPQGTQVSSPDGEGEQPAPGNELLQAYLNTDALERFKGEGSLAMTSGGSGSAREEYSMEALDKSHYWHKQVNASGGEEIVMGWYFLDGDRVNYQARDSAGKLVWKEYVKGSGTDDYRFKESMFRGDKAFWKLPVMDIYNVIDEDLSEHFRDATKSTGQYKGQSVDVYTVSWSKPVATATRTVDVKVYVAKTSGKPYIVGAERTEKTVVDGSVATSSESDFYFSEIGTASPALQPPA